ncbi:valine--tRNA ligase [Candidatus Parcubacteria bacterium]|nr:valine--tRNA ligase [Candidatus Parcubacteria bacterium]
MFKELDKIYNPAKYEDDIYRKWEKSGFFNPDNLEGEPYSIMMPPPNVTGVLHLGHALEHSLMDVMIRYQRMNGKKALLLPGTDHAAVATQAKVERILTEDGMENPREKLGRDGLLKEIRKYAENSKATILKQIKKIGVSCDWSRLSYTFDDERSKTVNEVFVKMYNDGLIYRGYKVINWTVKGQSTCSDDELEYVDRKAKFYTFKYSKDFPITIATTRPETKLGDTAVAVNPKDERYKKYIGEIFTVDIGAIKPLKIKIIGDENVDQNLGTGALGVTPAHSSVDFEMYENQKAKGDPIEIISVINKKGKMTVEAGEEYVGLDVVEAREKFVRWLRKNDLLEKEEEIDQNVGTSDRYKDVVEALPMTQWFVNVNKKIPGKNKSLKDLMKEAVTIGHNGNQKVTINPDRFEKIYFNWIDNLRDWCISRQVWWGHRIPAWYCKQCNKGKVSVSVKVDNHKIIIKDISELVDSERIKNFYPSSDAVHVASLEKPKKCNKCECKEFIQDEDTLDTWFSSGLWTFSTLDKGDDLKTFHPTSWMQMGHELLFFWMARMILMSTYVLDEIPFKDVYIHGMLRDEKGNKFSKSAGNNINPIEIIDKYGTDALRLSVIIGVTPGQDSKYYDEKVESARNFVNKLWNISRFIISSCHSEQPAQLAGQSKNPDNISLNIDNLTLSDKWIIGKLNKVIDEVNKDFNSFRFSQAAEKLRDFTKDDLADWYLEASKFDKSPETEKVLNNILVNLLKLWHPFIPFVTEKIWGEMFPNELIMIQKYPQHCHSGARAIESHKISSQDKSNNASISLCDSKGDNFELIKEIIIAIRNARSENKVEPAKKIKAVIYAGDYKELIKSQSHLIKSLRTGIEEIEIIDKNTEQDDSIKIVIQNIEIYLLGAIDKEKEQLRIKKEIENLEKIIKSVKGKLSNKQFIERAPKEIIHKEKERLKKFQEELENLVN